MEEAENVGFAVSPSSIPKNYVSLRQLRDLRLKEKQDEEERLRNQNLHLNQEQQHQMEGKRFEEDYFPYPNLNPTKEGRNEEGEPKPHPKPPASRYKRSPIGFRAVPRPEPARRPADDGPEANALGADLKRVIGDAAGDPNPQIGQVCSQTRKAEKKKGKGNGEKPEPWKAMPAAVSVNPKEVPLENAIQVKEGAGPDSPESAKQKPAGLQCSGSELMMQMEQQSVNGSGSWKPGRRGVVGRGRSMVEAAAGYPRPGRGGVVGRGRSMVGAAAVNPRRGRGGVVGRGRSMVGADAGLVWVKKTAGF